jgi:xanthine dehydrogenase YagR molybdenum-binding subunit
MISRTDAIGLPLDRLEGPEKVRGQVTYAYEWQLDDPAYLYPLQAEIAAGRVTAIDASAALAEPGVLAVLTRDNAMPSSGFDDPEIAVLRSDEIAFRGQLIGAVVAETSEVARDAAGLVRVTYSERAFDTEFRADRDDLRGPVHTAFFGAGDGDLQDGSPAATSAGDVEAALGAAPVTVDATYRTATNHHNPLEPHAAIACWAGDDLTIHCSSQGVHATRNLVASALGLDPERVRVMSPHVGGAFGSKVYPASYATLAAMAARLVAGRPVKFSLTRRHMFSLVGYRPPSIQRVRLGAEADGRLTAIAHDAVQQTAKAKTYAEQIATCSRTMYAAPNRRTTHRVAPLDVPVPTIMRAPGESSGMFALESAMDELAIACRLDPVELRIRNEPGTHPESGLPWSTRRLVSCLRQGADRFGWQPRDPTPGRGATGAGWSEPASRPPATPRRDYPATRRRSGSARMGATRC